MNKHTEDDTFNALKRVPYEFLRDKIRERRGQRQPALSAEMLMEDIVMKEPGWSREEFISRDKEVYVSTRNTFGQWKSAFTYIVNTNE